MNQFHTVVLERLKAVSQGLDTEPYEVGWATEAILFVDLREMSASGAKVLAVVQISADGINWVDEGTRLGPLVEDGVAFARLSHFGGWFRARFEVVGATSPVTLTVQLVLKG
jgi:hypothetical protein